MSDSEHTSAISNAYRYCHASEQNNELPLPHLQILNHPQNLLQLILSLEQLKLTASTINIVLYLVPSLPQSSYLEPGQTPSHDIPKLKYLCLASISYKDEA